MLLTGGALIYKCIESSTMGCIKPNCWGNPLASHVNVEKNLYEKSFTVCKFHCQPWRILKRTIELLCIWRTSDQERHLPKSGPFWRDDGPRLPYIEWWPGDLSIQKKNSFYAGGPVFIDETRVLALWLHANFVVFTASTWSPVPLIQYSINEFHLLNYYSLLHASLVHCSLVFGLSQSNKCMAKLRYITGVKKIKKLWCFIKGVGSARVLMAGTQCRDRSTQCQKSCDW